VKILFVGAYVPYPLDSGGRIRSFHLLRELSAQHDIHLLALEYGNTVRSGRGPLHELCRSVRTVPAPRRLTGHGQRFLRALRHPENVVMGRTCAALEMELHSRLAEEVWDLVILDDMGVAKYVQQSSPLPVLWSKHNCEWLLLRGHAAIKRRHPLAWALAWCETVAVRRWEGQVAALAGRTIVVSQADRDALRSCAPAAVVDVVPNGVDATYFRPVETGETNDVVFTGALFWYPNVDAVIWFASHIWPLIRREVPVARFAIVGREPAAEVQILGGLSGVEVVPNVADVRPYLARAAVCVAPLRCGGGTRLKILEALASGRPVVSTSVGVAGLELIGGRDLCVVDDPPAFAAACVELLRNPDLRTSLGQAGRRAVERRYDWGEALSPLCSICADLVGGRSTSR